MPGLIGIKQRGHNGYTIAVKYTTEEVINMVADDGAIIEPILFKVVVAPINQRGLRRSKTEALTAIEAMRQGNLINTVVHESPFNGVITRIWTFRVPIEHLRRVEKTLQRKYIPYRKFPTIQETNP